VHNDSHLITGLNSAASRREAQKKAEKAQEALNKSVKLKPHVEIINEHITRMRNEITDEARAVITPDMAPATIKTITLGAKWADAKLASLKLQLERALRAEKKG
jgi:hypothetical protein